MSHHKRYHKRKCSKSEKLYFFRQKVGSTRHMQCRACLGVGTSGAVPGESERIASSDWRRLIDLACLESDIEPGGSI
ncbi:unnamed protein product, partial [Brenthis ino]